MEDVTSMKVSFNFINFGLFVVGMFIVAISTNGNFVAMLGAFIASIHLTFAPRR